MAQLKNEQQHIEEIQRIISTPPSWLIRWGMLLAFVILLSVIGFSALIKYPKVVIADFLISSVGSGNENLTCEFTVPQEHVHTIHEGQKVFLKLSDVDVEHEEMFIGEIHSVSHSSLNTKTDLVKVDVDIKSFQDKPNSRELQIGTTGAADIIVADNTLLDRILSSTFASSLSKVGHHP